MKTLVIYYSYTGKTKIIAEELAKKESADIVEVKEKKKRSKFNAYVFGSFAAMRQKKADLEPFNIDFSVYEKIIIAIPIWAGSPAPAFNNIVELLPNDKTVELIMTSGSGKSSGSVEKSKELITLRNCNLVEYRDIKT
jgi:flavodoxin